MFDPFFSFDGTLDIRRLFKIDQLMNIVFFCKSFNHVLFMFIYSPDKIICYSHIQGPVSFTGKNIHVVFFHRDSLSLDSRLRGNDSSV